MSERYLSQIMPLLEEGTKVLIDGQKAEVTEKGEDYIGVIVKQTEYDQPYYAELYTDNCHTIVEKRKK